MRILTFIFLFIQIIYAQDSVYYNLIKQRKIFFIESFAQKYEPQKIKIDFKSKLEYIDFCSYPPDRSLPFGALQNGRYKGEKIRDLPFTCNKHSGAKKFFINDSNISQSYRIMRFYISELSFLEENMPENNSSFKLKDAQVYYIWEMIESKKDRLWVIYESNSMNYTVIFSKNDKDTEIIVQSLLR